MSDSPARERRILTPSSLNRLVRDLLSDTLPQVWVEGELSNVARPASGHLYFTLKDAKAQIRCAMFRSSASRLRFQPAAGTQVMVRAQVGLYEARGDYQLVVAHMEEAGLGALQRAFDELKARLQAEGLFAAERKRPLPPLARRIGVITSPTGAAIRDVLTVMARRFPLACVDVLPVPVQGKEAPPAIVDALVKANAAARHDVLLLTRGGGSLEDLWAFNEESVARAIHASRIPVMSAVGHEIDFSISDFVADARAPTPSAAAELLVPDGNALRRRLQDMQARAHGTLARRLQTHAQHLDHLRARLQLGSPQQRLHLGAERLHQARRWLRQRIEGRMQQDHARLAALHARLRQQHPQQRIHLLQRELGHDRRRLQQAMDLALQPRTRRLANLRQALDTVSPLRTLGRGYAIVRDQHGTIVRHADAVSAGTDIEIQLAKGRLHATTT